MARHLVLGERAEISTGRAVSAMNAVIRSMHQVALEQRGETSVLGSAAGFRDREASVEIEVISPRKQ